MTHQCPSCETDLEFEVLKLNIQDETKKKTCCAVLVSDTQNEVKPWYVVSKDYCPGCKYKISLGKFATSEEAYLFLGEQKELDLTGTEE